VSRFDGVLFDGRAATAVPVRVEVRVDDVTIADGTVTARVPRAQIVADAPIPGVPRTLRLPDGERVETDDHAAVTSIWPERGAVARAGYAIESRWWAVLGCIAITAVCIWFIVAVALPLGADPVARHISPEVELYLGKRALASLDAMVLGPSQLPDEAQREWGGRFDRFVAGESDGARYAIVFRHAGAPNAFALPGGTIVVTDEMVGAVGSADELLAVLAHEIGHVRGRHAMRLVLQNSGVAVLMTALAGDAVGVTFLAIALPSMLLQSGYTRQFEVEADDYAFAHMKRHGVSPQAFADALRRLERETGRSHDSAVSRYLGTHPATAERIRRAEGAR
jgi:predicted Zn-dependent protease